MPLPNYVKRRDEDYRKWAARQRFVDLRKAVSVDEMTDGDMNDVADQVEERAGPDYGPLAHVDALASLICEANPNVDRATALNFLLHTASGQSLIARTTRNRKDDDAMPDAATWMILAKAHPLSFVEAIEKGVSPPGDPYQLTNAAAKAAFPELSEARAFAKFVDAHPVLNKYAFAPVDPFAYLQGTPLTKSAPQATLEPRVSGGRDAQAVDDPKDAMRRLNELKAELRRANPELTDAQAFARVYNDPNNHAIAEAERRANRPRTGEGYF
jgi:hypothetical protein